MANKYGGNSNYKIIDMKKLLCFCWVLCFSSHILAQNRFEDFDSYMRAVYSLNQDQIKQYALVRSSFLSELEMTKNKVISSAEFKKASKVLYNQFYAKVETIFDSDQYSQWSTCIERLERYRELSEIKFVERAKIRLLYKAESSWNKRRINIRNMDIPGQSKLEEIEKITVELNRQIEDILGAELSLWYRSMKDAHIKALGNMDKYKISYNNAYTMAIIENDYYKQKQIIHYSQRKNNEKEELLLDLDNAEYTEIEEKVGRLIAKRWKEINDDKLDYSLKTRYGLSTAQISKYKDAYNSYLISEHLIVYEQRNLSPDEKRELLISANNVFCQAVAELLPSDKYSRWEAYRLFQFNKKLDRKSNK